MKPKRQEDSSCVFAYRFCRGTCHRRDAAEKRKSAEHTSAQVKKKSHQKAVGTIRQENRQGRGKLPPLYAAVRVRRRSCRIRIPDPLPGGSQDTGGAFRSRVQRPGVRHRSIGAGRIRPMWLRTDLVQVKRQAYRQTVKSTQQQGSPLIASLCSCGKAPETVLFVNG